MGIRTGANYIESLRDGRSVYVNGSLVRDVTKYAPFEGVIRELAALYDHAHDPELLPNMTYTSPTSGEPVSSSFMHVTSWLEMEHRIKGERIRSEAVGGWMGRQPDYMNAFVTDMAFAKDHFGRNEPAFGKNTWDYYELCREKDLCMTHALVDPQIDRSRGVSAQEAVRIVGENDRGLIVSGARMLATLAAFSDEIILAPYANRKPGEEDYAICFAVPMNTPGLKIVCRQTYDTGGPSFDHPLTRRFDEGDALAIFDNVLVPWERVFAARDLETYNMIRPSLPGYLWLQAVIRSTSKLRFMTGLATLVGQAVGRHDLPRYQEMVGELVGNVEIAEGLVLGAARQILDNVTSRRAATGVTGGPSSRIGGSHGTLARGLIAVSAIRLFFPQLHEKAVQTIRLMGSSGLIITPTDRDFENQELEETIARYFKGSGKTARERIKIMRLAWDAISTEFGGRQLLYEFFFAGDPFNNRLLYFGTERNQECTALAQRILDS